jgi:stalled ribosome rescue protein Dom34
MSKYWDAIVWIDRSEAKVFHVSATEDSKIVANSHTSTQRLHHQASSESGKEAVDGEFFHRICGALNHTGGTLITGPGNAKFELKNYLDKHRPDLAQRVYGVETLDHPGDAELLALARRFFNARSHRDMAEAGPDTRNKDTKGAAESIKR